MKKGLTLITAVILFSANAFGQSFVGKNKMTKQGDKIKYGAEAGKDNYVEPENLTSELYSKNIGKLLFSNKATDPNGNESQFTASFNVGESIYCRAFLETALFNYKVFNDDGECTVARGYYTIVALIDNDKKFEVNNSKDGRVTLASFWRNSESDRSNKKSIECLLGKNNTNDKIEINTEFTDALNKLTEGKHTVRVFLFGDGRCTTKFPLADGEFVLNKNSNAKLKGKTLDDLQAGMSDPKLEAKALEAISDKASVTSARAYTYVSLNSKRVKIMSKDWEIVTASSGVIIGRVIYVAAIVKNPKGECEFEVFCLMQQYAGGSYQQNFKPVQWRNTSALTSSSGTKADCE